MHLFTLPLFEYSISDDDELFVWPTGALDAITPTLLEVVTSAPADPCECAEQITDTPLRASIVRNIFDATPFGEPKQRGAALAQILTSALLDGHSNECRILENEIATPLTPVSDGQRRLNAKQSAGIRLVENQAALLNWQQLCAAAGRRSTQGYAIVHQITHEDTHDRVLRRADNTCVWYRETDQRGVFTDLQSAFIMAPEILTFIGPTHYEVVTVLGRTELAACAHVVGAGDDPLDSEAPSIELDGETFTFVQAEGRQLLLDIEAGWATDPPCFTIASPSGINNYPCCCDVYRYDDLYVAAMTERDVTVLGVFESDEAAEQRAWEWLMPVNVPTLDREGLWWAYRLEWEFDKYEAEDEDPQTEVWITTTEESAGDVITMTGPGASNEVEIAFEARGGFGDNERWGWNATGFTSVRITCFDNEICEVPVPSSESAAQS